MNLPRPENLGVLNELDEIERRQAELKALLESGGLATKEVSQAYQLAIDQLGQTAIVLASGPEIQSAYVSFGAEAQTGLAQLEAVKGVLPEEELEQIQTPLAARLLAAREFFDKYGARTPESEKFLQKLTPQELAIISTLELEEVISDPAIEVVAAAPAQPEPAPAPGETREVPQIEVEVVLGESVIALGKQRKVVPLSRRHYAAQADYSDQRRSGLKALIDHQAQGEMRVNDLWKFVGGDTPIDKNTMTSLRAWFLSLSYRRSPLIYFNGKRGPAAAYRVASEFKLVIVDAPKQSEIIEFPVEAGDMFITARHLEQFDFVLRQNNCPELESKLVKELERYRPDHSHIKGDVDAIRQSRKEAITRVEAIISSQEWMLNFIETTDPEDPQFKFIEYISGLEEEQLKLISRLMTARVERVPVNGGRFRIEAVDEDDYTIAWSDPFDKTASPLSQVAEEEPENLGERALIEDLEETIDETEEAEAATPEGDSEVEVDNGKASGKKEFNETELAKLKLLETVAYGAALSFAEHFEPEGEYLRQQVQVFLPRFDTKRVATAKDNHVITKEKHRKFGITDVVKVVVYTDRDLQNVFTNRKYKKIVDEILARAIKMAKETARQQLEESHEN